MNEKNKAPHTGKVGRIRYKVWENVDKSGALRYSIDVFRSIPTRREGEPDSWRDVHSFSEEDLRLMPLVLAEVDLYIGKQRSA